MESFLSGTSIFQNTELLDHAKAVLPKSFVAKSKPEEENADGKSKGGEGKEKKGKSKGGEGKETKENAAAASVSDDTTDGTEDDQDDGGHTSGHKKVHFRGGLAAPPPPTPHGVASQPPGALRASWAGLPGGPPGRASRLLPTVSTGPVCSG